MRDGLLVIGSGNQFYISDKRLDPSTDMVTRQAIGSLEITSKDLFHLTAALNGPLPLYHPQFLIQLMFTGRFDLVEKILLAFLDALRELDSGVRSEITTHLGFEISEFLKSSKKTNDIKSYLFGDKHLLTEDRKFTKQMAEVINEKLQKFKLPYVTGHQQITLATTVSIIAEISENYQNILDQNGLRFFMGVKLFQVNLTKESRHNSSKTVTMRDISFAMHSDYKDLIYNFINELSNLKIGS
ncbi:unnamed protein product [Ambrosiozyma monospora]|uniref:Unnamed protein product n=1 Tax=Ambrosiozyma monospora TaxID=43982 RepID=A0A9W6T3V8_AMBMO|nr:unnamed protein product [Ambrosiozyma monospora]